MEFGGYNPLTFLPLVFTLRARSIELGRGARSAMVLQPMNANSVFPGQPSPTRARPGGFTLIELILVIVLIGILAGLASNLLANAVDQGRFDATQATLQNINYTIAGNPALVASGVRNSFGYVGDMGVLPATLTDLRTSPCVCPWTYDAASGTGVGWNGPYIDTKQNDSGSYLYTLDGWGNALDYSHPPVAPLAAGQVRSRGSDNAAGGSGYAADITVPGAAITTTGTVAGTVTSAALIPVPGATVTITYPATGLAATASAATDNNGAFSFAGIPMGKRKLAATVGGTTYTTSTVVLPGATATVNIQTTGSTTTPSAPTAVTATPVASSQINLTWTAPTTNTDGSPLFLKEYRIYRGTATNNEVFYTGGVAGTAFSDVNCAAGDTYYYQVRATDLLGTVSAPSTEVSATCNPIQQTQAVTPALGSTSINTRTIQRIQNFNLTGGTITITQITLGWTGSATRNLTALSIGGTAVWSGSVASGSTVTLTTPYNLTTAGTPNMVLTFSGTLTVNTLTVQFNAADGSWRAT
jgi:prepilin-type N-terminal cleavage/methylation domain-containing protein